MMRLLSSNKEKNSKVSENKRLNVRCKYLEKELQRREKTIQDLMQRPLQYPAYSSPATQSKQALEALQRSYESNIVINLKKLIEDQKGQITTKDELIQSLKHDMKGTHLREVKAERNAFEEEAKRLRSTLENFVNEIGGVDQIFNIRAYLDSQQSIIQEMENQKATQQQIYDAKYDECLKLEK